MTKDTLRTIMQDAQAAHKAEGDTPVSTTQTFRVLTGPDGHRWRVRPNLFRNTQVAQVFSNVANDWVDTEHDPNFLRFLLDLFDHPFLEPDEPV